jgi:hypothetical protein
LFRFRAFRRRHERDAFAHALVQVEAALHQELQARCLRGEDPFTDLGVRDGPEVERSARPSPGGWIEREDGDAHLEHGERADALVNLLEAFLGGIE